jgi:hypothetical protein
MTQQVISSLDLSKLKSLGGPLTQEQKAMAMPDPVLFIDSYGEDLLEVDKPDFRGHFLYHRKVWENFNKVDRYFVCNTVDVRRAAHIVPYRMGQLNAVAWRRDCDRPNVWWSMKALAEFKSQWDHLNYSLNVCRSGE